MAFKLKRNRKKRKKKLSKKELLLKKLALMRRKMDKKSKTKIKSIKLNNQKQDSVAKVVYNGDNSLQNLNLGHLSSAIGNYRRGRIANFKN